MNIFRLVNENDSHTSSAEYVVEDAVFRNFVSDVQGGAIGLKNDSIEAKISSCFFICCSTTCESSSNARDSFSSGGACFLSVKMSVLSNLVFHKCDGNGVGAALYASTPQDNKMSV